MSHMSKGKSSSCSLDDEEEARDQFSIDAIQPIAKFSTKQQSTGSSISSGIQNLVFFCVQMLWQEGWTFQMLIGK